MGYSTDFTGELKFNKELAASELSELKKFFGEDCRDHPEWDGASGLYYIDLEFNDDFSGIRWNGAEKTYDMPECINMIITNMRKKFPSFGLFGEMLAQGEDYDDRWVLTIVDGKATRKEQPRIGQKITCPHCDGIFTLEAE